MKNHIKTSLDSIRRAPFQALAAISVLSLTFFVSTILVILLYASHQVLVFFETRPQVIVFLKDDANQEQTIALREKVQNDSRVKSLKFVSKEDALEIYKSATTDNPLLGELVSPTTFPASIEFSLHNLESASSMIDELKTETIVESVSFTAAIGGEQTLKDVIERLKSLTRYIRIGGVVAVIALSLTSFLVLTVVIGMRVATRRNEIESLSLIGATPFFIKAPIVLEAIFYSIIGVSIGWLTACVVIMYLTPTIFSYFGEIPIIPKSTTEFVQLILIIFGGELLVGLFLGFLGSLSAVSRSLRTTK